MLKSMTLALLLCTATSAHAGPPFKSPKDALKKLISISVGRTLWQNLDDARLFRIFNRLHGGRLSTEWLKHVKAKSAFWQRLEKHQDLLYNGVRLAVSATAYSASMALLNQVPLLR